MSSESTPVPSPALTDLLDPSNAHRTRNPLDWIIESLEGEERAAVEAALDNPGFANSQIANALVSVGYEVDNKQVHAYRQKMKLGRYNRNRQEGGVDV